MLSDPAPIDALLAELYEKQTVLRGWAAVLSLSEAAVDALAASQWPAQPRLVLAWAEAVEPGEGERQASVVHLELELDAPRFTLSSAGNAVAIRQPVRGAALRKGSLKVTGPATAAEIRLEPGDPRAAWSEPASLAVSAESSLEGAAPLAVVAHATDPYTRLVVLDLAAARFTHRGLAAADGSPAGLAAPPGSAFAGSQPRLQLAALDLSPGAKASALQPASLELTVARAKSGNRALQLLIGGAGGEPEATSIALDEPVPAGSDFSLVVSSSVVIPDIVKDFNVQPGLVKLAAVAPPAAVASAWYAQTRNPMQFQGSITWGDAFPAIESSATLGMDFKGSKTEGLVVSGYTAPDGNIALDLSVAGNFPITVSGKVGDQDVRLSSGPTAVAATGAAESAVKPLLESFLGSDVSPDMGKVSFDVATHLLLKRLSLPGKLPRILHAQIPGDLVLAGPLEPQPSPVPAAPDALDAGGAGGATPGDRLTARIPTGPELAVPVEARPSPAPALDSLAAFGANDATLSSLLTQMYNNQEVLQGWDAVMNLLESSVNQFFQYQWSHQTGTAGQMTITAVWCENVLPFHGTYITNVTEFSIQFGAPLFQFLSGSANVTVTQNILSGTLRLGTKEVPGDFNPAICGCVYDDPSVSWNAPITIDTGAHPSLSGPVALQQIQGLVNPSAHSLTLDFSAGAFTLNNLTVSGVDNDMIVDQIKNWFATNQIRYILASLDFQGLTGQPALTPTSFQFNVITTNAGNTIVQLLITTNGSQPSSKTINVNEPVPTADGLTCSLMVSSRILYNDVLVAGFNKPNSSFTLVPLGPGGPGQIWRATISPQMNFSGSFSFGNCCDETTVTYSIYLGGIYSGSTTAGFVLTQHITPSGNVSVNIDVYASNPVALSGSGAGQQLTITPGTPSVSVSGSAEGEIRSRLQDILNSNFRNGMAGISFTPITYFALKNLLFPGNLIKMSQAQVPGDLLIVGTFEPPT